MAKRHRWGPAGNSIVVAALSPVLERRKCRDCGIYQLKWPGRPPDNYPFYRRLEGGPWAHWNRAPACPPSPIDDAKSACDIADDKWRGHLEGCSTCSWEVPRCQDGKPLAKAAELARRTYELAQAEVAS